MGIASAILQSLLYVAAVAAAGAVAGLAAAGVRKLIDFRFRRA